VGARRPAEHDRQGHPGHAGRREPRGRVRSARPPGQGRAAPGGPPRRRPVGGRGATARARVGHLLTTRRPCHGSPYGWPPRKTSERLKQLILTGTVEEATQAARVWAHQTEVQAQFATAVSVRMRQVMPVPAGMPTDAAPGAPPRARGGCRIWSRSWRCPARPTTRAATTRRAAARRSSTRWSCASRCWPRCPAARPPSLRGSPRPSSPLWSTTSCRLSGPPLRCVHECTENAVERPGLTRAGGSFGGDGWSYQVPKTKPVGKGRKRNADERTWLEDRELPVDLAAKVWSPPHGTPSWPARCNRAARVLAWAAADSSWA